jgi:hypothetical protein
MPDAWANINAAAFLPAVCDPICGTCDIRATVRAAENEDRQVDCSVVPPARKFAVRLFARAFGARAIPLARRPRLRRSLLPS